MPPDEYVPVNYKVTINDFEYNPSSLTVKSSDTITFTNEGAFPRSATSFFDGKEVFDTDVLGPGKSATITVYQLGTFEFYSTTHRAMTGTVTVESNGVD
jgi:plastocyanin